MADLLHTEPLTPTANAPAQNISDISDVSDGSPDHPPTMGEVSPNDEHLKRMDMRQLRVLVNRAFKVLDSPNPPFGAQNHYDALVGELENRAREEARRTAESVRQSVRESFRDNALYRRFELRIDGVLAAHLKYRIKAGRIALIEGVEQPTFRDQGVEATLLRQVFLNTHKRRLSVIPQCTRVFAFLADNPEYQALAAVDAPLSDHLHT